MLFDTELYTQLLGGVSDCNKYLINIFPSSENVSAYGQSLYETDTMSGRSVWDLQGEPL